MVEPKPVFLNLLQIRFPVTAITSILHRASGVLLFLFLPALVYVFSLSLQSEHEFTFIKAYFERSFIQVFLWLGLSALLYHVLAGVRHLIMDCGIGESKEMGKITSILVLVASLVGIFALGYRIWLV